MEAITFARRTLNAEDVRDLKAAVAEYGGSPAVFAQVVMSALVEHCGLTPAAFSAATQPADRAADPAPLSRADLDRARTASGFAPKGRPARVESKAGASPPASFIAFGGMTREELDRARQAVGLARRGA